MLNVKTGFFLLCACLAFSANAATITKLSVAANGESNGASINTSISADGQIVVFESDASNLVANDLNNSTDIFVADVANNTIERISVGYDGSDANGPSTNPVISSNGRYVVFESFASNLVTGDSNSAIDIFVYDRMDGSTVRASVSSSGSQAASHSFNPSISADGQFVAFYSLASNLVSGDTNRAIDVFVHDTLSGITERVSVDAAGNQANMDSWQPRISANGMFVVFSSNANNLVSGDTNGAQDIILFDRQTRTPMLLSKTADGLPANGGSAYATVNADGSVVVYESDASNVIPNDNNNATDIFVFDKTRNSVNRVSQSLSGGDTDGPSYQPAISEDGRFISFFTYATNLVASDFNQVEDVFVYDRQTGYMQLLTNTGDGLAANLPSFTPSLSADGRYVSLFSLASNLATPDTNNAEDIFLYDRGVINTPPIANAGNDANVILGSSLLLDGSASFDPDGNPINGYLWQIVSAPANSSLAGWTAYEVTPNFIPDVSGVFVISLVVNDGLANSIADEVFINVSNNLPPVANITTDATQGYAPLTVRFDGSQSYDPEAGSITWDWNFGDGGISSEAAPTHVYTSPGSYLAVLIVTDEYGNQGQAELPIEVLAVNQSPVITRLSVMPSSGSAPLVTELTLQVTDAENDHLSISWDLGDGTLVYDVLQLSHSYEYPGTYQGIVSVSDGTSSVQQEFTISVGSDFVLKDESYKIFIHHDKPQRSKFRFETTFEFNGDLANDDIVSLQFAGLDVFEIPLHDFQKKQAGLYIHKSRHLLVTLDLNNHKLNVYKQRLYVEKDKLRPFAGIILRFGSPSASKNISLTEREICHRKNTDRQIDDHCSITVLQNVDSLTE